MRGTSQPILLQCTSLTPCSSSSANEKQVGGWPACGGKESYPKSKADSHIRKGKEQEGSSQGLTFSLGAVVDLAVLLGDGVGVGRREQVLGRAGHSVLTLVLGAHVGGGREDPGLPTEGAVVGGHFLPHRAPGNNGVLLTGSKETKTNNQTNEAVGGSRGGKRQSVNK